MADEITNATVNVAGRHEAVERLYLDNYGYINDLALNEPNLTFEDGSSLVEGVARHLWTYQGELNDEAFQAWVTKILVPSCAFLAIQRACEPYVRASIWKILGPCADLGVTSDQLRDVEQTTWLWAWTHLDELRDPAAKAKPTTRLYGKAREDARTIRKQLLRHRERFGGHGDYIDLSRIGADANGSIVIEPLSSKSESQLESFTRNETVVQFAP